VEVGHKLALVGEVAGEVGRKLVAAAVAGHTSVPAPAMLDTQLEPDRPHGNDLGCPVRGKFVSGC